MFNQTAPHCPARVCGERIHAPTTQGLKAYLIEFLRCELSNAGRVENAGGDSSYKKRGTRIGAGAQLRLFCSRLRLSPYAFAQELCSQVHRTKILVKYSLAHRGLDLGPLFEQDHNGHHRDRSRKHACREGMRCFPREYPWLSMTDWLVARTVWQMGFESGGAQSQNTDSCSPSRNDSLLS